MKTIIERGASWTLEETKLLLALWGQDLVQRQTTNMKRTKEVYEKISEKFNQGGYERTADQVRTRVFNMIAEYRRILKDPTPDRMKKCIFFEALHKIYAAKHMDDVKAAIDDYEPEHPYSPFSNTISSDKGDESISDSEATDCNDTNSTITNNTQSATGTNNANSTGSVNNNNNNTNNSNNNSISNDNGDSIANNINNGNTSEKESATPHNASKKIRLESPKSAHSLASNAPSTSTSAPNASASTNSNSTDASNSKQVRSSMSTISTSSAGNSLSSSSASHKHHQSLLLPHATTSAASSSSSNSTPISKITTSGSNNTPSYININSTKLPIIRTNQLIGHSNGNESINLNGTAARLPTTAAITSHQLYQAPVNTFDVTSSALLIDRMFAHLSRESENMREWIALEKERLALERARRQQEAEREARRDRVLTETLMKYQDQWLSFLSKIDPRVIENSTDSPPELKIPPEENQ